MKRWMTASYNFLPSETQLGGDISARQHRLEISFQLETWTEYHPYGATTAGQELCDVLDTGYTIRLDNYEITREQLEARFGKAWVDHTIEYMEGVAD